MMGMFGNKDPSTGNKKSKEDLTALKYFDAAREGDLDKMRKYVRQNRIKNLLILDECGRTALHLASEFGRISMVRYLVHECQMDLETLDQDGRTVLHSACRRNQLRMVQCLLGDDDDDNYHGPKFQANVRAVDHSHHTALHFASFFGYLEIVRVLIHAWPDNIVATGTEGHTPLHTAAEAGHFNVVRYFLEDCENAHPEVTTHNGMTPLHFCSHRGHIQIVKYLILECQVNLYAVATHGAAGRSVTAYDLAQKAQQIEVMEYLDQRRELIQLYFMAIEHGNYASFLKCISTSSGGATTTAAASNRCLIKKDCGIDVATTKQHGSPSGNMALHVAAASYQSNNINNNAPNGYLEIIKYIIQELHIPVDMTNDMGWTAVHLASAVGHVDVVRYLVDHMRAAASLLNHPTGDGNGETPLHLASRNGHVDMVRYLISVGRVSLTSTNREGQTPQEVACISGQDLVVDYYVQRQEVEDQLFDAARLGDLDCMKECIKKVEYGIDVTSLNVNQSTVLHFACRYGHLHIVQYLTQNYDDTIINVNARNKDGCTPLHFASSSGHLHVVKYLIEEEDCHSFVNDLTNDGSKAYDLALSYQHFDVSDYLSHVAKLPNTSGHGTSIRSLQPQQSPSRPSFRTVTTTNAPAVVPGTDGEAESALDPEIVADRIKLENVINNPTADPTIIGLKYIDFCTNNFTSKSLGEGAFGKVYLGYDHNLNNVQLAVKRIRFDVLDENKMNQITSSFRREISVRHLLGTLTNDRAIC